MNGEEFLLGERQGSGSGRSGREGTSIAQLHGVRGRTGLGVTLGEERRGLPWVGGRGVGKGGVGKKFSQFAFLTNQPSSLASHSIRG